MAKNTNNLAEDLNPLPSITKKVEYHPTEEAIKRPRRDNILGVDVGIGGEILIEATPPKSNYTVPEATPEQYKMLYECGFLTLVKKVEINE